MGLKEPEQTHEPPDPGDAAASGEEQAGASPFPIVGVGASAGGLEAFTQLLAYLPGDTGMAFVLVQHLDPKHESKLGSLLAKVTPMPVTDVTDGLAVEPDCVYVIPQNTTMTIARGVLKLAPRGEARGPHLPVDHFLKSLADDQQSAAVGVILSGTGSDGTLGLAEVKAAGGITFVQDKETAKYDGMPQSAIASGSVDFTLPPIEIARELTRIGRHSYLAPATTEGGLPAGEDEQFRKILGLLRAAFGVDFTQYRDTTIRRRTMRRMALHAKESLADYARQLEADRPELHALYQDVLINVTSFFRDPEMFESLKESVFPEILKTKTPQTPIRIWTAGCSTGQEAYSLAIALSEFLDDKPVRPPIQIFATDLSDTVSLEKARLGLYPENIEAEVSPERLRRFFTKEDGKYRIIKSIRDVCVFAKHNLASDPPFSRVDLVSCRNVLIYLAPPLQKRVIPTFHYALNPTGFLMLGASESVGAFTDLFGVVDKTHKIFSKKATTVRQYPHFNAEAYLQSMPGEVKSVSPSPTPADFQKEADRIILGHYAPAGVLVSESLEILQFRGRTSPYLEPAPGAASFNLLKMAREGLFVELKSALAEAKTEHRTTERRGVRVRDGHEVREVNLKVEPVTIHGMSECCFLILFEEAGPQTEHDARGVHRGARSSGTGSGWFGRLFGSSHAAGKPTTGLDLPDERDRELLQLRRELAAAREQHQHAAEQHDAANEELKSANEEILSSNEELQSTNEELETAKEELQSVNEELTTVNEQLQNRNLELSLSNNDLTNLIGSATIPIVMLGSDLRIRRFTPMAGKVLNLVPSDVGRPIGDFRTTVEVPDLEALLEDVIATVRVIEREVRDREGRWYQLRLHPYRTVDNKIDGAVLVLLDINESKSTQLVLKEAGDYTRAIVETVREPLLILAGDLRVKSANESFYQTFQVTPEKTEGQFIYDLGDKQWDIPQLKTLLEELLPTGIEFDDFSVEADFPAVGHRVMLLNARRLLQEDGETSLILLAFEDITDRRRAEAGVRASELRYRRLFESARDGILMLDPDTRRITDVNPFMTEFLGYSREEFLGKELWEIGLFKDQEASRAAFRELQEQGFLRYEDLPLETKEGVRREVEVVSNLYREDGHAVIQCNIRDVTERKLAEEALRASEDQFRAVFNQTTGGIAQTDLTGRFVLVNDRFCEITGRSREDLLKSRMQDITHPEDLPVSLEKFHTLTTGQSTSFVVEKRYVRSDGSVAWVHNDVSAIHTAEGDVRFVVAAVADITEAKRAETLNRQSEERYRTLVGQVKDYAIFRTDPEGHATTWNEGVKRVLGFDEAEFVGKVIVPLIFTPEDVQDGVPERELEQATATGEASNDRWMRRKDGTRFYAMGTTTALCDETGKLTGFTKVMRDQTDRKRLEDELRQSTAALSEADHRKNEFLAMLAHELRNPLAAISNAVELSNRAEVDADSTAWGKDVIKRQVGNLSHLVNDLMDVSRITQGKVQLRKEPVELGPLIARAVAMVQHHIDHQRHDLSISLPKEPVWLEADPTRLEQVFSNLLGNAAKYTEPGGRIGLQAERQGKEVVIAVRDTGVGISPEMLTQVFDLFTQVERSSDRSQGGLGIGLTVVRSLIEMHGGTISAASTPGEGSVFTVRLPIAQAPPAEQPEPAKNGDVENQTSRRILIIDDNADTAQSMARLLKLSGHRVETANDGPSAIDAARAHRPDVMLLDIGLPGMDGYEVAATIRQDECCKDTVIIGVSGYGQEADRRRSREAGFNHHLVKPVDYDSLIALIEPMH